MEKEISKSIGDDLFLIFRDGGRPYSFCNIDVKDDFLTVQWPGLEQSLRKDLWKMRKHDQPKIAAEGRRAKN